MQKLARRVVSRGAAGCCAWASGLMVARGAKLSDGDRDGKRGRFLNAARTTATLSATALRRRDAAAACSWCQVCGGGWLRRRWAGGSGPSRMKTVPAQFGQRSFGLAGSAVAPSPGASAPSQSLAVVAGGDGGGLCFSSSSRARTSLVFTLPAASRL